MAPNGALRSRHDSARGCYCAVAVYTAALRRPATARGVWGPVGPSGAQLPHYTREAREERLLPAAAFCCLLFVLLPRPGPETGPHARTATVLTAPGRRGSRLGLPDQVIGLQRLHPLKPNRELLLFFGEAANPVLKQ